MEDSLFRRFISDDDYDKGYCKALYKFAQRDIDQIMIMIGEAQYAKVLDDDKKDMIYDYIEKLYDMDVFDTSEYYACSFSLNHCYWSDLLHVVQEVERHINELMRDREEIEDGK